MVQQRSPVEPRRIVLVFSRLVPICRSRGVYSTPLLYSAPHMPSRVANLAALPSKDRAKDRTPATRTVVRQPRPSNSATHWPSSTPSPTITPHLGQRIFVPGSGEVPKSISHPHKGQ